MSPQFLFESSQMYLYEYDSDFELVNVPRHVCPWAVVRFQYVGKTQFSRPPALRQNTFNTTEYAFVVDTNTNAIIGGSSLFLFCVSWDCWL